MEELPHIFTSRCAFCGTPVRPSYAQIPPLTVCSPACSVGLELQTAIKGLLHNMAQHQCESGCHIERARAAVEMADALYDL